MMTLDFVAFASGLRRPTFIPVAFLLALALSGGVAETAQAQRQPAKPADLATLNLEQLMDIEVVFAASKRNQNPRDAASVVTVVTSQQIKRHGYRTLADILRSVPSFYVSYDRNYTYVGVRGFLQPGDYSTRVLLLVNGLRTNDNIYELASVGEEFLVDVDLIDRVEVVRGPSAAIYGSSAFFAVINVVTRRGADIHGAEVSVSASTFGTQGGRATYGTSFDNGIELVASASGSRSDGARNLYYAAYDDPSTNNGIAEAADAENSHKLFLSASKGDFSFEASRVLREKHIPTGAFSTAFNDPRSLTVNGLSLAAVSYDRVLGNGSLSARLHSGRWTYEGAYAGAPEIQPNQDRALGEWVGLEVGATRTVRSRSLVTAGLEYRDNFRQDQRNWNPEPYESFMDVAHSSKRLGLFAQNELTLGKALLLYTGIRQDWYETFGAATSPRVGLIYNPGAATTVKAMVGRAFRAPNEYEFSYAGGLNYKLNPLLKPERIATTELAVERRMGTGARVTVATYLNHITELVRLTTDPTDSLFVFRNLGQIDARGLEIGFGWNRGRGVTGDVSVSWQHTVDQTDGQLTNSPTRLAKAQIFVPIVRDRLSGAVDAQYVGARGTLAGQEAKQFIVTNFSVLAPSLIRYLDVSATAYNVFGATYGYPGSEEHRQDVILQDGRTFRLKATLRF